MMKLSRHWTVGGSLVWGDAEDEHAPIVKVQFCNEAAGLSPDKKIELLRGLVGTNRDTVLSLVK